jgi:hypothetical protein
MPRIDCRRLQNKAIWKKPPGLKINKATKPQEGSGLSGVVVIHDEIGPGLSYIKFDDTVRCRLAKYMPRGIGDAEQAYIHVELQDDCFAIYCVYLDDEKGRLLWREDFLPQWIGYIKRP